MPILSGDIKLVASQVMDDVPEGGGAPTSTVIADGVSNAIFPDISELDRAGGRVNLRKLHVSVQTNDRDTYLGSNVIVAEPPADPNVSITLFTTNNTFDTRSQASSRVESYLNKGTPWPGFLFENHIAGQRSIQLFQRPETELPTISHTLALVRHEGQLDQSEQYVRTTAVSSVIRKFYDPDSGKDYDAAVVTLSISDALRFDMEGSPASRAFTALSTAVKLRDTLVADAGTYVGVVPLSSAATMGDFTLNTTSVFTQLVPSAQTETPITDIRTNGLSAALVATGSPVVQSISTTFTTSTSMQVGGPMLPTTLSIERGGVTATDKGGLLVVAGVEVGQVDYDNGIISLSNNVWGTGGGTHTVTFTPATTPDLISSAREIPVTQDTRSLNYTLVIDDLPLPRTLTVSYLSQGRWYVLRDTGGGVLSGVSSSYGIGTVNYTTGSILFTLGALPDVGSSIIVQNYSSATTVQASNTFLLNNGKLFIPINTDGILSTDKGSKPLERNSVTITWNDGAARTAIDNGSGALTGDATGVVLYSTGVVYISPNALPPPGTSFSMASNARDTVVAHGVTLAGGTLGATSIHPGSVYCSIEVNITYSTNAERLAASFNSRDTTFIITDDGAGNLYADRGLAGKRVCGTINYAAGTLVIDNALLKVGMGSDPCGPTAVHSLTGSVYSWARITSGPVIAGSGYFTSPSVNIVYTPNANVTFSVAPGAGVLSTVMVNQYLAVTGMVPNYTLKGVGLTIGSSNYVSLTDGTLLKDPSPTSGGGTPAGSVASALGVVSVTSWPTGASPVVSNWRGLISPPAVGVEAPFSAFSTVFRTASSPLRPSSLSVLGTMQDGTTFNVTSDSNGKINGTRVKGTVDYQYGLVRLYFVNPSGPVELNVDLTSLGIAGLTSIPADLAMLSRLRYSAVAYSYLPLDASILGIDPVRLPSDGRVPIFRPGGFAVAGHTGRITATVTNSQVINCARVRLSRVRIVGSNGVVISTGYTADLDAGTVTFSDVSAYVQPITIEHRVEDMGVIRDVQISGEVTFTRPLTHDYPLGSFLSSALIAGDLKSRVSTFFDQATWGNTWSGSVTGSVATGTYNTVASPLVVTNAGAITERWALVFTNSTTFSVIGEHVGVIGTGSTGVDLSPVNPVTGVPYFTVPALGWGNGWAAGNALRFDTVGAMAPVWVVRTVQQGAESVIDDKFTLLVRGDVDRP